MQDFNDDQLSKILTEILNGQSVASALNISDEVLESLYNVAYNNYVAGNFADAETAFKALCLYNYWDSRFLTGLAGCRQARNDFEGAIDAYQGAAIASGMIDPTPLYYACVCLLKLGRKQDAIAGLEVAIITGNESEFTNIRTQAKELMKAMKED